MRLSLAEARRIAVMGQLLDAPGPSGILETVERLGRVQMDPTSAVARTELLVLWSRLGAYDPAELETLLWDEKRLFEYRAFIVPTSDYAIHREAMRTFLRRDLASYEYARRWLETNAQLRRHILSSLRRRGPLRTRDFEDRAVESWRSGGWNEGKNVSRMLELLWGQGKIAIVGRDGQQRLWDLAERRLPVGEPRLPKPELARRVLAQQLRARGVARADQFGFVFGGRPAGREGALRGLVREGVAVPVEIDGLAGGWFAHAELLGRPFRPRTTLLSPFDALISNRERTEELFGFRFRLEIYVPKAKRRYGYFVMPVLQGERLVGRIDPFFDRKERVLRVNAVHWEPGARRVSLQRPLKDLARFLGAARVEAS